MTSLIVDEEEETELAGVGASLGLPSGARHSLPAREYGLTGADETCPLVCMMKSSWLTISLQSLHCPHPFSASLFLLGSTSQSTPVDPCAVLRETSAGWKEGGLGRRGCSLVPGWPGAWCWEPHAYSLRQLPHHQPTQEIPGLPPFHPKQTIFELLGT